MNVIIAGASKGIGKALSLRFAHSTIKKILLLSRNEFLLQQLTEDLKKFNPEIEAHYLSLDLINPDFTTLHKILHGWENVDILINNAGLLIHKPFEEIIDEEWLESFQVNLMGPVKLIRQLLPLLKNSTRPHVVNISSMGGFQGSSKFKGLSSYSSSKAALANLTECLAEEYKEDHIFFNCLALGAVQTEMLELAFPGYKAPVSPEQMADYIFDFSTKAHYLMNGKIVPVSLSTP
jgi:3-oxoacyl-[acyl-carrier protein] reductase